jgi:hypothetical protein
MSFSSDGDEGRTETDSYERTMLQFLWGLIASFRIESVTVERILLISQTKFDYASDVMIPHTRNGQIMMINV